MYHLRSLTLAMWTLGPACGLTMTQDSVRNVVLGGLLLLEAGAAVNGLFVPKLGMGQTLFRSPFAPLGGADSLHVAPSLAPSRMPIVVGSEDEIDRFILRFPFLRSFVAPQTSRPDAEVDLWSILSGQTRPNLSTLEQLSSGTPPGGRVNVTTPFASKAKTDSTDFGMPQVIHDKSSLAFGQIPLNYISVLFNKDSSGGAPARKPSQGYSQPEPEEASGGAPARKPSQGYSQPEPEEASGGAPARKPSQGYSQPEPEEASGGAPSRKPSQGYSQPEPEEASYGSPARKHSQGYPQPVPEVSYGAPVDTQQRKHEHHPTTSNAESTNIAIRPLPDIPSLFNGDQTVNFGIHPDHSSNTSSSSPIRSESPSSFWQESTNAQNEVVLSTNDNDTPTLLSVSDDGGSPSNAVTTSSVSASPFASTSPSEPQLANVSARSNTFTPGPSVSAAVSAQLLEQATSGANADANSVNSVLAEVTVADGGKLTQSNADFFPGHVPTEAVLVTRPAEVPRDQGDNNNSDNNNDTQQ